MTAFDEADLARAALETVRAASAQARLIAADEALAQLRERGFGERLDSPPGGDPSLRVAAILAELPAIASLASLSGRALYHDPALLSRAYARILARQGDPAALLAEEIRANSREHVRPVPVELFERPPFALTPAAIEATLEAMAANPAYRDIARVTTSMGAVYLFSSRSLAGDHAAFLAEREDSLALNP